MNFYYKDANRVLRTVHATDVEDIQSARYMLLKFLRDQKEVFVLPILGVIRGGKQ
jgi:hypothetical protein